MWPTTRFPVSLAVAVIVLFILAATFGTIGWLLWVVIPKDQSLTQEVIGIMQRIRGEDPDKWEHFVYNYQTLIGGMLAILAAVITVVAMIFIDRKQAARHNQLVELNVRVDKLRLERLLVPQLSWLTGLQKWFSADRETLSLSGPQNQPEFDQLQKELVDVQAKVLEVHQCVHKEPWKAGVDMFDGQLANDCAQLARHIDHLLSRQDSVIGKISVLRKEQIFVSSGPTDEERARRQRQMDDTRDGLRIEAGLLAENLKEFASVLEAIVTRLRALAREYGIELPAEHFARP